MGSRICTIFKKEITIGKTFRNSKKNQRWKKRGKAISSAKKRIERETGGDNAKEKYASKSMKELNFNTNTHGGKLMIRFENIDKTMVIKKYLKM